MTITLTREEAQQVLDALEAHADIGIRADKAIETLRARLAQPEPDYEAEFIKDWNEGKVKRVSDGKRMVPEREWQGLTEDEAQYLFRLCLGRTYDDFWRAIEAKLKEKNGG
jgi:hypothetical protein